MESKHRSSVIGLRSSTIGALLVTVVALASGLFVAPQIAEAAVELQAQGAELCFKCHSELKQKFAQGHVHPAVKQGACASCHSPHAAKNPKLLREKSGKLCYICHKKEQVAFAQGIVHRPVWEGNCTACHDAHAGPNKFQLTKVGGELCFTCHEALKMRVRTVTHPPFEAGKCLFCHDPHASKEPALLKGPFGKLCESCHKLSEPKTKRAHGPMAVAVEEVACNNCHIPHGSEHKGLIKTVVHPEFAAHRCGSCHVISDPDPTKNILTVPELCFSCHPEMVQELKKKHIHPAVERFECTACHAAHASELKALMAGKERTVCLSCHKKIRDRFWSSASFHPEKAEDGKWCTMCHRPHSADKPALFAGEPLRVCGECHKAHVSLSHPMGSGIKDPRTNEPVTCLSCHDPHGTSHSKFLILSQRRDLCIQCHEKFR